MSLAYNSTVLFIPVLEFTRRVGGLKSLIIWSKVSWKDMLECCRPGGKPKWCNRAAIGNQRMDRAAKDV